MPNIPTYTDIHDLTPEEQWMLKEVNRLLWTITDKHSHVCQCEYCTARAFTDVQDEELAFNVPYLPDIDSEQCQTSEPFDDDDDDDFDDDDDDDQESLITPDYEIGGESGHDA